MKSTLLFITLLGSMIIHSMNAEATVIARFDPSTTYQEVGSTFDVRIVADVPDEEAIVAWAFRVLYDPSQLILNSVYAPLYWDLLGSGADRTSLSGLLLPELASPEPGLSGPSVLLATLNFTYTGLGTTLLGIAIDAPDPNQGFFTFSGESAEWEALPEAIGPQTHPIPEPETLVLLGIGLAGMIFRLRKLQHAARLATATDRYPKHHA